MQSSLNEIPGFNNWYLDKQELLKKNEHSDFFKNARNNSQKQGMNHVGITISVIGEEGMKILHSPNSKIYTNAPGEDLYSASLDFFKFMLDIVLCIYVDFGIYLNAEKYFTEESLTEKESSIDWNTEYRHWGHSKPFSSHDEEFNVFSYWIRINRPIELERLVSDYLGKTLS